IGGFSGSFLRAALRDRTTEDLRDTLWLPCKSSRSHHYLARVPGSLTKLVGCGCRRGQKSLREAVFFPEIPSHAITKEPPLRLTPVVRGAKPGRIDRVRMA